MDRPRRAAAHRDARSGGPTTGSARRPRGHGTVATSGGTLGRAETSAVSPRTRRQGQDEDDHEQDGLQAEQLPVHGRRVRQHQPAARGGQLEGLRPTGEGAARQWLAVDGRAPPVAVGLGQHQPTTRWAVRHSDRRATGVDLEHLGVGDRRLVGSARRQDPKLPHGSVHPPGGRSVRRARTGESRGGVDPLHRPRVGGRRQVDVADGVGREPQRRALVRHVAEEVSHRGVEAGQRLGRGTGLGVTEPGAGSAEHGVAHPAALALDHQSAWACA